MRTLRLSLAGTVILSLLGGLGAVGVVAQSADTPAVWVTYTEGDCTFEEGTSSSDRGVDSLRGMPITCDITFSDPRVSGTLTIVYNEDCFEAGFCVYWGSQELVGPDGAWTGWVNGTVDPKRATNGYLVMTGTGGYEGLTFVRHAMGPFGEEPEEFGVIYEGDPPPMP